MGPIKSSRPRRATVKARNHIIAAVSTTALALGGVTAGLAASNNGPQGGPKRGGPPGAAAIASYLGLSGDQIRTQIEAGKTLAQIAAAQNKSVSGLEDAIVADAKSHLDADVTAGKLTQAQEDTMLAKLKAHVDEMVTSTRPQHPGGPGMGQGGPGGGGPGGQGRGPGGPGGAGGPGGPGGKAIASYLGLTNDQIHTQVEAGKTLAQITTAQGKTVSGLEDAIVADAKSHLDADVKSGKLTQTQADTMLANLKAHVDEMVTSTHPPHPGPGGPGGGSATKTV